MILTILACVLVFGVTSYLVFTQGFFSSAIMAGLCVTSAAVAFNYHELLAQLVGGFGLAAWGGKGIMLLGLFMVALLILRLLVDRLIRGNVIFPILIDRIGAGVFGFVSGLIVTGMILLGLQNMAFPASLLGFDRIKDLGQPDSTQNVLPPADGFVTSLIDQMSRYGFSGSQPFHRQHPNYLRELYMNRLVLTEGSRQEAGKDVLDRTDDFWLIDHNILDVVTGQSLQPAAGMRFMATRLEIAGGVRSKDKVGVADPDSNIRFTLASVRLVGYSEDGGDPFESYPVAILWPGGRVAEGLKLDQGRMLAGNRSRVDLLFEVPEDLKNRPALFIEFKRSARVMVPDAKQLEAGGADRDVLAGLQQSAQAGLQFVGNGVTGNPYGIESLRVISRTDQQPLEEMLVPDIEMLSGSRQTSGYIEHVHAGPLVITKSGRGRTQPRTFLPLLIPEGYCLVYLTINEKMISGSDSLRLTKTVLLDTNQVRYNSVGSTIEYLEGTASFREFAYSARGQDGQVLSGGQAPTMFPDRMAAQSGGRSIRRAVYYYLIPQQAQTVGLLGALIQDTQSGRDIFYGVPQGEVDILAVPAL